MNADIAQISIKHSITMSYLQVSSNQLADACYMSKIDYCLVLATILRKLLVCYHCAWTDQISLLNAIATYLSTCIMLVPGMLHDTT